MEDAGLTPFGRAGNYNLSGLCKYTRGSYFAPMQPDEQPQ